MGITTRMISEDTGMSLHSLSNWRQGESNPNQINLLKLRDYSLTILSEHNLDFPLKKELREPIEKFCKYVEEVLREMPKKMTRRILFFLTTKLIRMLRIF